MIDKNKLKNENENTIQYKRISGKTEEILVRYQQIIKKILKKLMK
jgi:hypothetical protein